MGPEATRQYIVFNKCPSSINLYIGGVLDSNIPSGGNVTKFLGLGAGFFYTDANGGNANGIGTTRAGFFADDFYYIVKDPSHFNTGISVAPQGRPPVKGFCPVLDCEGLDCSQAFTQPPIRFPVPGSAAPTPPYFRCPTTNTTYDITFCPTGKYPSLGTAIHPNFNTNKCIDVRGAILANGTPVQIYDCNGTPAQRWIVNRGSTKVQLAGTNFCLDAGTTPANGVGLKIWQCFDKLPAQQWFYTNDNRIALEGQGFCTDLTDGKLTNSNPVQTWKCTDFDANQIWTL
ncbi:G-X-X-X-Q-X-W domain-containing protein [Flammula alnicola]|nr:G-X-X-X-Q-X-W domain-containing protein [Flammula alnicola]